MQAVVHNLQRLEDVSPVLALVVEALVEHVHNLVELGRAVGARGRKCQCPPNPCGGATTTPREIRRLSNLRIIRQLSDLAHLRSRWAPWVIARRCIPQSSASSSLACRTTQNGRRPVHCHLSGRPTFANLDLDTGVALGDILDAANNLGHLGAD